jgi:hypothetical protein
VGGERGPGAAKPDGVQSSSQETFLPRNNLGYLAPDRSVHLGGPEARHSTDTNHHFGTVESSGKEIAMPTMEKTVVGVLEKWDLTAKGSLRGAGLLEMQYAECDISFTEIRIA